MGAERGAETASLLLARGPTQLVLCMSDTAAYGVYEACHAAGLSIPGDISVVGGWTTSLFGLCWPPLTTVVNPASRKEPTRRVRS
jgi:DNA-binding LacI/PurR family transcriptional regulator